MNQPTKKFGWTNRDAVAHDMLQVVHYAPTSMSRRAASLMEVFRSEQIRSQLSAIILDDTQDDGVRIYALRAYTAIPGDHVADQFISLTQRTLAEQAVHKRQYTLYRGHRHIGWLK